MRHSPSGILCILLAPSSASLSCLIQDSTRDTFDVKLRMGLGELSFRPRQSWGATFLTGDKTQSCIDLRVTGVTLNVGR